MPARKGLLAPQNTFLDTIATRFDGTHSNFVLGNAKIAKVFPIVYCSDGFCELTGYSRAQIMQKSCACNFLYGQKTDLHHKAAISAALESKQELKLEVILYRSSGTPFWCLLDIVPIQDEKHEVVLFLCSHKDITKQKLHEQQQKIAAHQQQLAAAQQLAASGHDNHLAPAELLEARQGSAEQLNKGGTNDDDHHHHHQLSQEQQLQQQDDQQALISMEEFKLDEMEAMNQANEELDNDLLDLDNDDDHDKHTASQYSRRRSRAVLYQLSGHYGYRRSVNMKSKLKLNNRMTIPEYKTTTIEKQTFILSHYGVGRSCWDWLVLIVSFYVAIVVPYNATFKEKFRLPYEVIDVLDSPDSSPSTFSALQQPPSSSSSSPPPPTQAPFTSPPSAYSYLHPGASSSSAGSSSEAATGGANSTMSNENDGDNDFNYSNKECKIDSIDIFVEVVFLIDVILNFRTTFVNRKGEVVTRPKIICKHYVRGWFVVDACAALPFDLLCGFNLYSRSRLNLLKLIRLLRLLRLIQKMDKYSQYSFIILTLMMLGFSLLAHWCACIWYVIAMEEIEDHPAEWKLGWIHQLSDKLGYNVVNATDMASSYVTALYFTTSSLTSVGFGNVSANTNYEKIFSIVIMLIGALMHAVVFGNVTALIRVMYARRSNYQTRLRDLKDFFRLHQLPKDLQQRMSDYFQTTWSLNHGIDTSEILKDFPEELRGDVSLHLHREVLSLPIFGSAPQGFLKSLARHIESKFCCPTEYLIHRGDALCYLYLVCNGSMEVLQDNMVVGILGKGDLVGYDVNAIMMNSEFASSGSAGNVGGLGSGSGPGGGLGGGLGGSKSASGGAGNNQAAYQNAHQLVKSSSDLKALTYCDLKCIHIGGLLEVLKLYPEFSDTFHDEIIHDLSFNLREQHEELTADDDDDEEDDEDEPEDEELDEEEEEEDDEDNQHDEGHSSDNHSDQDDDQDQQEPRTFGPPDGARGNKSNGNGGSPNNARRSPPPPPPSGGQVTSQRANFKAAGEPNNGEHQIGRYYDDDDDDNEEGDHREDTASYEQPLREADNEPSVDHFGSSGELAATDGKQDNGQWQKLAGENEPIDGEATSLMCEPIGRLRPTGRRRQIISSHSNDWHNFSLSCDDQLHANASSKASKSSQDTSQARKRVSKNRSNDAILLSDNPKSIINARPLRSAIGISNLGGVARNKPPLSFDLSRNTTAIVDRRRRSAGCIQKPNLIGVNCAPNGNRAHLTQHSNETTNSNQNRCHSSLIHISENEPMKQPNLNRNRNQRESTTTNSSLDSQRKSSSDELAVNLSASCGPKVKSSYSNQDFKQIDAHITASVRKLRQEFRQELSHAVELLTKLVLEREPNASTESHSSIGSQGKGGRLKSHLSGSLNNNQLSGDDTSSLVQSTSSLTNKQSLRSDGLRQRPIVASKAENRTNCNKDVGATNQISRSISSLVGMPSDEDQQDTRVGQVELQQSVVSVMNDKCPSAQKVITSKFVPSQRLEHQVPVEQTNKAGRQHLMTVNSDNDSGRSTSSLNSSGNRQPNRNDQALNQASGGRLAKMRLMEETGGGDHGGQKDEPLIDGQDGRCSYVIDIENNDTSGGQH